MPRPYVLLSVAVSLDGYIDDSSETRLLLSDEADFDRVDEVRSGVDAILVGANTVRRDDPRLLVRSTARLERRRAAGIAVGPSKVTLTRTGELDPDARFFTTGDSSKLVYASTGAAEAAGKRLGSLATVVPAGEPVGLECVLTDLAARGVRRLLVEGGAALQAELLAAHLVDELHLVYAPLFVGSRGGVRLAEQVSFYDGHPPMTLAEVRRMGEHVLLRYLLEARS